MKTFQWRCLSSKITKTSPFRSTPPAQQTISSSKRKQFRFPFFFFASIKSGALNDKQFKFGLKIFGENTKTSLVRKLSKSAMSFEIELYIVRHMLKFKTEITSHPLFSPPVKCNIKSKLHTFCKYL